MYSHATAVLEGTAGASSPVITTRMSGRDRWLARCESQLAKALATGNGKLLPVAADLVLCSGPRCPDCYGTGYTWMGHEFTLCYCMFGERPAYDIARHTGEVVSSTVNVLSRGRAEVWVPCPDCAISPAKYGPYCLWCKGHVIRVPWLSDCGTCHDTGWMFSHIIANSQVGA